MIIVYNNKNLKEGNTMLVEDVSGVSGNIIIVIGRLYAGYLQLYSFIW
jgi:hypothetical protein